MPNIESESVLEPNSAELQNDQRSDSSVLLFFDSFKNREDLPSLESHNVEVQENGKDSFLPELTFDYDNISLNFDELPLIIESTSKSESNPAREIADIAEIEEIKTADLPDSIDYPDGRTRELFWQNGELQAMTSPDGTKWERSENSNSSNSLWRSSQGALFEGEIELVPDSSTIKISYKGEDSGNYKSIEHFSDGSSFSEFKDGSTINKYANGDSLYRDTDAIPEKLVTADGVTREFGFSEVESSKELNRVKITLADGTATEWHKRDGNWFLGNNPSSYDFAVDIESGVYSYTELGSEQRTTLAPGQHKEIEEKHHNSMLIRRTYADNRSSTLDPGNETEVFRSENKVETLKAGEEKLELSYDDNGDLQSISSIDSNREIISRIDGGWQISPFDGNSETSSALSQEKIDEALERTSFSVIEGEVLVDPMGLIFIARDDDESSIEKVSPSGETEALSLGERARALASLSSNLSPEAKVRFAESAVLFQERADLSLEEKDASFEAVTRLLESEDGPFSESERHVLAAQLLWHLARPFRQEQGQNNTCNVTALRTRLIMTEPSKFADMIADIGTTGKYTTDDGSEVVPPIDSLRPGQAEGTFPPERGSRSWLGKVSDVTMANIHWQRQTVDTYGNEVPKGSLKYEVLAGGNGDTGERLYRYDGNRLVYELRGIASNYLARGPEINMNAIGDIQNQISGNFLMGDCLSGKTLAGDDGGYNQSIESMESLEEALASGSWPKIIGVHTGMEPFNVDSGYGTAGGSGGWHVVLAHGIDSETGNILIDNSWSPSVDRNTSFRGLSLEKLYNAMKGPY